MSSFVFDIGEKSRKVARGIGAARDELRKALAHEKRHGKLTQQEIASRLGVNRSVVNRQFLGVDNLTFRSAIELAWAMGWDTRFEVFKPEDTAVQNEPSTASRFLAVTPLETAGTRTASSMLIGTAGTTTMPIFASNSASNPNNASIGLI